MTVRKRSRGYQADFMWQGTRYRETFDTHSEAEGWELQSRLNLRMGKPLPGVNNGRTDTGAKLETLGALFEHVKRTHWGTLGNAKSSRVLAHNAWEVVVALGPAVPVHKVTKADLDEVYVDLIDKGNSPATANRKMAGISKLLTEAQRNGVIAQKPRIPKQKESEGRIRYITVEEEAHIAGLFVTWGQPWLADFLVVAVDTGLRLSEMLRIEWRDISPDGTMLHVWVTKNKLSRSVPLTKRAREALARVREATEDRGPFVMHSPFGQLRTLWDRMRETTGYHDVTVHTLRHTCASRLAQTPGINLQYVQKWLGHKNIKTTMRYAHLANTSLEHCMRALEGYHA